MNIEEMFFRVCFTHPPWLTSLSRTDTEKRRERENYNEEKKKDNKQKKEKETIVSSVFF